MKDSEKQLILKLKQLKNIQPDSVYLGGFKRVLETKMALASRPRFFAVRAMRFSLSFATALLGFVSLGYLSVLATQNIPVDNVLYPVRLMGEKLQLGVQGLNQGVKTDLMLKFAENRLAEIKILEEKDYSDSQRLRQFLNDYNLEIAKIQTEILSVFVKPSKETLSYLLEVELRLVQITEDLDVIRFDADDPAAYLTVENMLVFTRDLVSRKIFEYELQLSSFAGDVDSWNRAMREYLRLKERSASLPLSSEFLDKLEIKFSIWLESFEKNHIVGEEKTLLELGILLKEIEIELAKFEVSSF